MYSPISIQVAPYDQMFGLEKNVFEFFSIHEDVVFFWNMSL
jgi:hypothetical protein